MTWWLWVLVAIAGALGGPLRYIVDNLVSDRTEGAFPYGTMVVNASGSLLLGILTGLAMYHGLARTPRVVLGTGLIGSYTTFSTFSFETIQLVEVGEMRAALTNAAASVIIGGLAAGAGLAVASL
jgi:fluoride exporter